MSYTEDNARTGRVLLPDLVRAFALFGIVLVNVGFFAYPGEFGYHAGGLNTGLDSAAYFAVNSLFLLKSYTLFSFMFGVGLAYQMMAAERRGARFGASYLRRMLGLILLGVAHVSLAFVGDILIIYGVLGLLLYLFRNAQQKTLLRTGLSLVVVQVAIVLLLSLALFFGEAFSPEELIEVTKEMQASMDAAYPVYADGSFTDIAVQRWLDWTIYTGSAALLQGPGVFGFFLLGLAAVRAQVLNSPAARIWARARRFYLPIGVTLSVIGSAVFMAHPNPMDWKGSLGIAVIILGAPFSSLGYIGLIAKWSEGPETRIKTFFARGGTASLTAYLMQSLILSFVFCGYGLGLYREIGAFACIAIALLTGLFTIVFSSLWRTRFKRGPMEVLLRSWTYLKTS